MNVFEYGLYENEKGLRINVVGTGVLWPEKTVIMAYYFDWNGQGIMRPASELVEIVNGRPRFVKVKK